MNISIPLIWIILGFICILLEFVIPGALIVFLGLSAVIVGLLIQFALLPASGGIPLLVFAVLTVAQIIFLRKRFMQMFKGQTVVDEGGSIEEFVGKEAVVDSGFADGAKKGKVTFKGTQWSAIIEDSNVEIGESVEIVEQSGLTLTIKKLNS